jgi:hypothetical protein
MSNTKREPLLSVEKLIDEFCEVHPYHAQIYAKQTACWVRDFYEAARAKDAELIQRLVDGVLEVYWFKQESAKTRMNELLAAAAAAGYKPTDR